MTFHTAEKVNSWTVEEVSEWLHGTVMVPDEYVKILSDSRFDGVKLLKSTEREYEDLGIPWGISTTIFSNLERLKIEIMEKAIPGLFKHQQRIFVPSRPYHWPYNGNFKRHNTAFIVIDMQIDFCAEGGYVSRMGYPIEPLRKPIQPIQDVLTLFRKEGIHIIHTREGHRPDLSDVPHNKRWRSERIHAGIGDSSSAGRILVRGSPGWNIIPELAPLENEVIIDKPGKGAFWATDLDFILRLRGITNIVFAGVTTDVCVATSMREANDRGFECVLLEDCCAATDPRNHQAAINMVHMSGGIFGTTIQSGPFIEAIEKGLSE